MNEIEAIQLIEHTEKRLRGGSQIDAANALNLINGAIAIGKLGHLLLRMKEWHMDEYLKLEKKEKVV